MVICCFLLSKLDYKSCTIRDLFHFASSIVPCTQKVFNNFFPKPFTFMYLLLSVPEACEISFLTGDPTCAPCIGRWRLNHWSTRKVPRRYSINIWWLDYQVWYSKIDTVVWNVDDKLSINFNVTMSRISLFTNGLNFRICRLVIWHSDYISLMEKLSLSVQVCILWKQQLEIFCKIRTLVSNQDSWFSAHT